MDQQQKFEATVAKFRESLEKVNKERSKAKVLTDGWQPTKQKNNRHQIVYEPRPPLKGQMKKKMPNSNDKLSVAQKRILQDRRLKARTVQKKPKILPEDRVKEKQLKQASAVPPQSN
ncbi:uncharacterized protein LOC119687698 [Teleopsis dalmanni]|uniref:uncharacterized protein LOC119687698 n=1 Tax=Teleopsis dalmanni TaxID=139649 RepID=UPI0018CE6CC0|nr:uncharacterized protein LOC119687698 [Teleopsis dalmanni]